MAITADQVIEESDVDTDTELVADTDTGVDEKSTSDSTPPGPQRGTHPRLAAAVLILTALTIAVAVCATRLYLDAGADKAAAERDRAVLDTGRKVAAELVTLDHNSAQHSLDTIAANSTGTFRDQFAKVSGTFSSVLTQGQVISTGEVKEAGIVSSDDHHATVLAAVTSTVKNTEAPEGQMRVYRMKMTLDKLEAKWLVSNVEFVA
ncbi:hypothetical protein [Nocardia nova]|uniref:hypothetical protein n=1 Tax=Nocardia nova TaxID=37330 RepID=UPI0011B017F9|nr:hypothetical protein [Nocardia nova]